MIRARAVIAKAILILGISTIGTSTLANAEGQRPAETPPCTLSDFQRVFVVGEIHLTPEALSIKELMTESAFKNKVMLGLEIDADTLYGTLLPQFRDSIIPLEESFSKGFALNYWAWWTLSWNLLNYNLKIRSELSSPMIQEALDSFVYFLGSNTFLKEAYQKARADKLDELAKTDHAVATAMESINAGRSDILDSHGLVTGLETLLKETLRAYTLIALKDDFTKAKYAVPAKMGEMPMILDFREIKKGSKDYYILYRWFWTLHHRLYDALVVDWRSDHMSRSLLKAMCARQAKGLPTLPVVTITGGAHISKMEATFKQALAPNVRVTAEMPPQVTGEFADLTERLKRPSFMGFRFPSAQ